MLSRNEHKNLKDFIKFLKEFMNQSYAQQMQTISKLERVAKK